jgi:hypothetical protein
VKLDTPPAPVCGILLQSCAPQTRNRNRLFGFERGAQRARAGGISEFATLVPKSYSDSLSPVSSLVLLERISYPAGEFGER